jgi:hypothetical protein
VPTDARSLPHDLDALARSHDQGILLLLEASEKRGERHRDRTSQLDQRAEARRRLRILNLREHALRDPRPLSELLDGETELIPVLPHSLRNNPCDGCVGRVCPVTPVIGRQESLI